MRDFTFPHYPSSTPVIKPAALAVNDAGMSVNAVSEFSAQIASNGHDALGWTTLRPDNDQDRSTESETKIAIEFVTRSATAMVGQVMACDLATGTDGRVQPCVNDLLWVDILLRQIPQPLTSGLSAFEFSAQALTDAGLEVRKTARSVLMPVELQARFLLTMTFKRGNLRLSLHTVDRREQLSSLEMNHFGGCTPVLRLRSGRQPYSSSVVRANYELVA